MNQFAIQEIKEMEKKLAGYQYLLTLRYANLCIKADPMALLPVSVLVGTAFMDLEQVAEVNNLGEYHFAVIPNNPDVLHDLERAILKAHPEFKVSTEQMDDDDPQSAFLLLEMPEVDKDRRDLLTDATKSLYEECKARMEAVVFDEKKGFAELLVKEPESLKEVSEAIKKKYEEYLDNIDDLKDKKLTEIEEAYEKYLESHPENGQGDDIDVSKSMRLFNKEEA